MRRISMKKMLLALVMMVSASAYAGTTTINSVMSSVTATVMGDVTTKGPFHWAVGDTAAYKLNMGGMINGTMSMTIKDVQPTTVTIEQAMDLGFAGKQDCIEVIDSTNGSV